MTLTADATAEHAAPRNVLPGLCVSITVGYGALYYAFAVLGPVISRTEGWSLTAMTAAFSVANLIYGVVGIFAGHHIQRHGPRTVMVAGAVLGPAALVGMAVAHSLAWFLVGLVLCGVAATGLFYESAFAAITHWYGEHRVRALTALTLVAGFASTIFAPLTTQLNDSLGWRSTYLALAGILLISALPVHAIVLNHPWPQLPQPAHAHADGAVIRSRAFVVLAVAAALVTLAEYASLIGLVPLLTTRGLSASSAAWILGIGGVGQVLGRLFYPWLARTLGVRGRATAIALLVAVPIGLLALVSGPSPVLLVLSVLAGLGRGLFTLITATLVSDLWGHHRYAALNGVFSAPLGVAGALGPFAGAAIASGAGYPTMFAVLGVIALGGAVLMAVALLDRGDRELLQQG